MNIEYHKWWSSHIGKDMELKVYGHAGRPVIVFPCSSGRFFDFEDRGMIHTIEHHINEGRIILFSVDSLDWETWHLEGAHPAQGAARHEDYDKYIIHEVVPFIHNFLQNGERIVATGASMGAYHAVNFFFRHPDVFGGTIALSGNYKLTYFTGGYVDDNVYFNSPLHYLPKLNDEWYFERYRNSDIFVCVGQGAWEDSMLDDTRELKHILDSKGVPAHIDFWGHDVNHDWPWWIRQFPYFVDKLLFGV